MPKKSYINFNIKMASSYPCQIVKDSSYPCQIVKQGLNTEKRQTSLNAILLIFSTMLLTSPKGHKNLSRKQLADEGCLGYWKKIRARNLKGNLRIIMAVTL